MNRIGEDLIEHVPDVLSRWEALIRDQPWRSLSAEHRINGLPKVLARIADAALCRPVEGHAHGAMVEAAVEHGATRRTHCIPEHLMFAEYHLLRQAIWDHLAQKFGVGTDTAQAIMRIDAVITVATNASMWGYHRQEIEAAGKWEAGIERMIRTSPFLAGDTVR